MFGFASVAFDTAVFPDFTTSISTMLPNPFPISFGTVFLRFPLYPETDNLTATTGRLAINLSTSSLDVAASTLALNSDLTLLDRNFNPSIVDLASSLVLTRASATLASDTALVFLAASSRVTFNSVSALADSISFVKLSTTDCFALTSACNCSALLFLALSSCCCKSESVAVSVVSFDSSGETLAVSVLICSVKAGILFSFSVNEACMFGFATDASDTAVFACSKTSSESSLSDLAASNAAFKSGFDVSRVANPSAVSTLMLGY